MPSRADELILQAKAGLGDRVRFVDGARSFEGVLMPRHAASDPNVLILKLSSGYNVGIRCEATARLEVVAKAQARPARPRAGTAKKDLPRVALLGTGGTIASFVDYRTGAVHPAATAEELAFATPELFEIANVESEVVFQVFSEDLEPANWSELARRVKTAFDRGVKGVVVPHGTDTLHFTAAALSFQLSQLPGPVVLVGAQRSSDRPSSDAAGNLAAAVRVAANADLGEVVIVMHDTSSDGTYAIHRGTRARKNHTSRRDAFESMNAEPIGRVDGDTIVLQAGRKTRAKGPVVVRDAIEHRVRLVWSSPILQPSDLVANGAKGILLVGTGLGHVPRRCLDAVAALQKAGVVVGMTSQCLWGRVNLNVYSTGRDLLSRGVLPAEDMVPEVALVKLMWLLANIPDANEVRRLFRTDLAGEIAPTTPFEASEVAPTR